MVSRSGSIGVSAGQPPWLVTSPASTGTRVHWSGRTSCTSAIRSGADVALDVVFDAAAQRREHRGDRRARPGVVMCRASARGCTVMPGAPASTIVRTASRTLGTRAAARVAQSGDLVDVDAEADHGSNVREADAAYARCVRTAAAISSAQPWISR